MSSLKTKKLKKGKNMLHDQSNDRNNNGGSSADSADASKKSQAGDSTR